MLPQNATFLLNTDPIVIVIMTKVNTRGRSHMQFVVSIVAGRRQSSCQCAAVRDNRLRVVSVRARKSPMIATRL